MIASYPLTCIKPINMKKVILTIASMLLLSLVYSQTAREFYLNGLDKVKTGMFEEAAILFSKSIELQPEDYYSWYNRGIAKSKLGLYEEAMTDFDQVIKLSPEYKMAYLNRGTAKKRITDYEGALSDYSHALKLDPNYSDAYYNRGLVYEMLSKTDLACPDFIKAKELGLEMAQRKIDRCNDTTVSATYPILRLAKKAVNNKYGFTSDDPVKVGTGPDGGPANQRAYLNLLRDKQGKPLNYNRKGSCCDYKSENGFFGLAKLDIYEINYLDENGSEQKNIIYISFYDYEEPQVLFGFNTVSEKRK